MKFFINTYRHKALKSVSFIGLLLSLMMLTACSSDGDTPGEEPNPTPEPPTEQTQAISFGGLMQDEASVTRSSSLQDQGIYTFTVWGYKNMTYDATDGYTAAGLQTVMDAYTVNYGANTAMTTTSNTNDWEYVGMGQNQTIKYWDLSARAYRFFGATEGATVSAGSGSPTATIATDLTDLTDANSDGVPDALADLPYFITLWFSTGDVTVYPGKAFRQPVRLVFVQPYCKVRFMFTFAYPDRGITLTEKVFKSVAAYDDDDVVIPTAGTFTVTYPLTGTATKESYSVSNVTASITAFTQDYYETPADTNAEKWYYVLPAPNQGAYKLTVEVNGEPKEATVPAEYMNWLPGYQYTYVFKITDEGGVEVDMVSSAFTEWSQVSTNHEVYNW